MRVAHYPGARAPAPVPWRLLVPLLLLLGACAHGRAERPSGYEPATGSAVAANGVLIRALGLVGTPYRYGGNTPEGGFDCSGLIGYVYRKSVGQATPRTVARMVGFGRPVAVSVIRSGDLVLFGASTPSHAGIYVGDGRFVHAPSSGIRRRTGSWSDRKRRVRACNSSRR